MPVQRLNLTYFAALLMALTLGVHLFLGGPEYHEQYQRMLTDANLRSMAAVLWHIVSVILASFSFGLFYLAQRRNVAVEFMLSGIQLGFAALFLWYGLTELGSIWPLPQWTAFTLIPLLTFIGQRRAEL